MTRTICEHGIRVSIIRGLDRSITTISQGVALGFLIGARLGLRTGASDQCVHPVSLRTPHQPSTFAAAQIGYDETRRTRTLKIILANPRGFCAGVNMAIESLERALELFGTPLYVYHEIVHNRPVVERFRGRGVVFVDRIEEIPQGAHVLYSAHGVAPFVRETADRLQLQAIDATCPLVTKVHLEAVRFAREGYTILLIGHDGHDEVVGTMGEAPANIRLVQDVEEVAALDLPADARVAYLTQTTLSVDDAEVIIAALRRRFPQIVGPSRDDICYATQNRQEAVKELVPEADLVIVLGSRNSSNSLRLAELAESCGKRAFLIDGVQEIDDNWFTGDETVLITAGASAPEEVVQECIDYLRQRHGATIESRTVREEHVSFPLPRELRVLVNGNT
jgi:4-hydroxy-3-methylbut-2-enyl diphosphate reductase